MNRRQFLVGSGATAGLLFAGVATAAPKAPKKVGRPPPKAEYLQDETGSNVLDETASPIEVER